MAGCEASRECSPERARSRAVSCRAAVVVDLRVPGAGPSNRYRTWGRLARLRVCCDGEVSLVHTRSDGPGGVGLCLRGSLGLEARGAPIAACCGPSDRRSRVEQAHQPDARKPSAMLEAYGAQVMRKVLGLDPQPALTSVVVSPMIPT